jgi:hypothetical protein
VWINETAYVEKGCPRQSEDEWEMEFLVFPWILDGPGLENRFLVRRMEVRYARCPIYHFWGDGSVVRL